MILFLSLLIRSGIILVAAELLRRGLRGSPAARRHSVVLFALALLIYWPLLAAFLPAVPLSWPAWWLTGASSAGSKIEITQTFRNITARQPARFLPYWPGMIWGLGALVRVTPYLIGAFRLRRIVRRAKPFGDERLMSLVSELCQQLGVRRPPEVLLLAGPAMPMAFGMLRPRIVLPDAALGWTASRVRTVLLHELAHVRRRDVASQLLAQLTTTLWWFQPAAWISRRSLRRESERACDELVLRHGVPASAYAATLLEVAKSFGSAERYATGIPMATQARHGDLEDRLHNILSQQPSKEGPARFRFAVALSCLAVLTMASSAVTFTNQPTPQRSSTMTLSTLRRTVLSGLLASAGVSAASIGGSLLDPHGAPIADAKATIYSPDSGVKKEATTAGDGKFAFESLPAGRYILAVEKPGFPSLYREFKVLDNSTVDRGLVLGDGGKQPDGQRPKELRIGGEIQQSKLIYKPQPVYPVEAKKAHIQGQVELEVVISKEGIPQDIRVMSSPSDALSRSALEAVSQWRYSTTLLNGEPISVVTDVIVNYTLSE